MLTISIIDSCRTNNFTDNNVIEKILKVWNNAADYKGIKYGVYSNYENNYKGDYTLSVAVEENIENAEKIEIIDGEYSIFEVDFSSGAENSILETWKKIWSLEEAGELNRNYILDFEKYYPSGKIEIHIGVLK